MLVVWIVANGRLRTDCQFHARLLYEIRMFQIENRKKKTIRGNNVLIVPYRSSQQLLLYRCFVWLFSIRKCYTRGGDQDAMLTSACHPNLNYRRSEKTIFSPLHLHRIHFGTRNHLMKRELVLSLLSPTVSIGKSNLFVRMNLNFIH